MSRKALPGTSPLRGKVALITGASRGIGLAIARALAAEGCRLFLTGRDQHALARTKQELSNTTEVESFACDIRVEASVRQLGTAVRQRFRRLDILINNAGVAHASAAVTELPYATWRDVIETNLNSLFLVTHTLLPLMRSGGAVVNNLSIAARRAFPGSSAYNASKHGALGFTNTLREELREQGIRVIALLPGATDTEIWNTLWPQAPRKKMIAPQTVAAAVVAALTLPAEATVEELVVMPRTGTL